MIEYEFRARYEGPRIFSCTPEEALRLGLDMLECPISLYVPYYTDPSVRDKIQDRIESAVKKMVEELNSEFQTEGVKT